MAGRDDLDSGPTRRLDEDGDVAVKSGSETDLSLVALIRQALEASGLSPNPGGSGNGPGDDGVSVSRIGKFEVLGVIGRGGFGTVLLVRDPDLGRERALKVPNPETLGSPGALARFLGEARLAARVEHPNVVRVYEAATHGAVPYIVMEYCPGGSLGQWLAERSKQLHLPQRWVAALVAEIAEGVHQAHLAGLLHRDIKPANVLLERIEQDDEQAIPRFRPKIADFGLAKVFERDEIGPSMTVSNTPLGTWAYMSPEQARGDKEIRATTDVYAIGAILHELLTGQRLYANLTQPEILGRLLGTDPTHSPRAIREDLHRDLETICRKCLEKTPTDRYQNSSELTNDLRRYLEGLPILARPAPSWKRVLAKVKRHPVRSALTGLVLTSVVAGSLAWSVFREQKRRGDVEVLLNRLGTASVAQFPGLIPQINATDPRVADRLKSLFVDGKPTQKLAAALVLGIVYPDYRTHSYDQLLRAEPGEIAPIAGLLSKQKSDLPSQLAREAETPAPPGTPAIDSEAHDHRRANAANALICLDSESQGWNLLRFQPDPQARSFLIHQLGPAGVSPRSVFDRLKAEYDATIRHALILALGEMGDVSWDKSLRAEVEKWIVECYENDRDPGVHGATKWLLGLWKLAGPMREAETRLASSGSDVERRWRIGTQLGLTFIRVEDAETGRIIEIADTEVTVAQMLQLASVPYLQVSSPGPEYPINGSTYLIAAEFLNRLSQQDQIPEDQLAYRPGVLGREPLFVPAEGQFDRIGYRLPTDREFERACRAGTTSPRYHGASTSLLAKYAWYGPPPEARSSPVSRLKPNDWGLFDMLGNIAELCQLTGSNVDPNKQVVACGGNVLQPDRAIHSDAKSSPMDVKYSAGSNQYGFRIARTVRTRGMNRPPNVR